MPPSIRRPVCYLLSRFSRPYLESFVASLLLLSIALLLSRIPPLVIGVALDALLLDSTSFVLPLVPKSWLPTDTETQTALIVGVLGAAVAGETAAKWYGRLLYEKRTLETLHDVRTAAFATATELSLGASMDGNTRGREDRLSILHDDADNLKRLFAGLRDGVLYGGNIVSAFVFMLLLNWNLALILLVLPVAIATTGWVYSHLLSPRYDTVRGSVGTLNARLRDAIVGQETVKSCNREHTELERVAKASRQYRNSKWSTIWLRAVYNRISWVIAAVGIWGLFAFGSYWILTGPLWGFEQSLTAGTLLTFILYTFSFLDPTRRLAVDVVDAIEDGRASARRVVKLLESDDQIRDERNAPILAVEDGQISYEDVSYTYTNAETPAVRDISFETSGGDFVGVVGPSGAGKSTICSLLFRFREPESGTIIIDSQNISEVSLQSLRSHIGYVSQDPHFFPGTVRENIAYARPDTDDENIRKAAKEAGAHEFVTRLPDGYDTDVGEHGATLSGGQRQRIAFARALLPDPNILVLDEATSHVDNSTGLEIQRRLLSMAGERTIIAVSHRLPTVRHADQILVLKDGRLVEKGVHENLINWGGTYETLWAIQTGEVASPDDSTDLNSEVFG